MLLNHSGLCLSPLGFNLFLEVIDAIFLFEQNKCNVRVILHLFPVHLQNQLERRTVKIIFESIEILLSALCLKNKSSNKLQIIDN